MKKLVLVLAVLMFVGSLVGFADARPYGRCRKVINNEYNTYNEVHDEGKDPIITGVEVLYGKGFITDKTGLSNVSLKSWLDYDNQNYDLIIGTRVVVDLN